MITDPTVVALIAVFGPLLAGLAVIIGGRP